MAKAKKKTVVKAQEKSVVTMLKTESCKERVLNLLKGSLIDPREFAEQIAVAFNSNPDVAICSERSKFEVAMELAVLNLTPSWDHVALIPRGLKTNNPYLTYMIQFQGVKALIDRSGIVKDTTVVLLHKSDAGKYRYDGAKRQVIWNDPSDDPNLPFLDPFEEDREINSINDLRGGYLIITFEDGRPEKHHLVHKRVYRKAMEAAQDKSVWSKWFSEQCHKTTYHNAFNRREVPLDPKIAGLMTRVVQQDYEVTRADPSKVAAIGTKPARDSYTEFEEPVIEGTIISEPEGNPMETKETVVEKGEEETTEHSGGIEINSDNWKVFESGLRDCNTEAKIKKYVTQFRAANEDIGVEMDDAIDNRKLELAE